MLNTVLKIISSPAESPKGDSADTQLQHKQLYFIIKQNIHIFITHQSSYNIQVFNNNSNLIRIKTSYRKLRTVIQPYEFIFGQILSKAIE